MELGTGYLLYRFTLTQALTDKKMRCQYLSKFAAQGLWLKQFFKRIYHNILFIKAMQNSFSGLKHKWTTLKNLKQFRPGLPIVFRGGIYQEKCGEIDQGHILPYSCLIRLLEQNNASPQKVKEDFEAVRKNIYRSRNGIHIIIMPILLKRYVFFS